MRYDSFTGCAPGYLHVVLPSQEAALNAVKELDGAPLFSQHIQVQPHQYDVVYHRKWSTAVEWGYGWLATEDSNYRRMKNRKFFMKPPVNGKKVSCYLHASSASSHIPISSCHTTKALQE
jgi:RNA recognition motif-containing protein